MSKEQVSTFEDFKVSKPTLVESLFDVTDITCGEEHIAAITSEGKLYTWGRGNSGILGHENEENQFEPKQIQTLDDETVTLVRLGNTHMGCLTDNREMWTCGNNFLGQLGRILPKSKEADFTPKVVEIIQTGAQITEENLKGTDEIEFVDLCCLKFNTLAITSEGQLFSCGKGGSDGSGHGDNPHTLLCIIDSIKDLNFARLSCGYSHHVAAVSENGTTYIWGNGEYGKLGLNDGGESHSFPQILFPKKGSPGHRTVVDIACGETHSAAIVFPLDSDERPDIISTESTEENDSAPKPVSLDKISIESPKPVNIVPNPSKEVSTLADIASTSKSIHEQNDDKKKRPILKSDEHIDEKALIDSIKLEETTENTTRKKGATLRVSTIDGDAERHERSTSSIDLKNGAASTSASSDDGNICGYLNKKGEKGIVKLWRKRWFQMTKDSIEYYEKEKGALKGEIKLANIMDILPGSSPFSFNIISKTGRIYELQASKRDEMEKWSKAIKTARNNIK